MVSSVLGLAVWLTLAPVADDARLVWQAAQCVRASQVPVGFLLRSLAQEADAGVPPLLRGFTLAATCQEAGFNPTLKGDCHLDPSCPARGVLQFWPWAARQGLDRLDPDASVAFLLGRIQGQLRKVRKRCPRWRWRTPDRLWLVAWVRTIRAPHPSERCGETPLALRRLCKWRRRAGLPLSPRCP